MFGIGSLLTNLISPSFLGVVSLVAQGVGTMMQVQAQKQALAYQQMQAKLQEKQYQQQAEAAELEARQRAEERRNEYFDTLSTNRALMAQSGITLDSPSYRAFLEANYDTYKKDIGVINLEGLEKKLSAYYDVQQAQLQQRANEQQYKTNVITTLGRNLLRASDTLGEL
jgi:hypothetical protein